MKKFVISFILLSLLCGCSFSRESEVKGSISHFWLDHQVQNSGVNVYVFTRKQMNDVVETLSKDTNQKLPVNSVFSSLPVNKCIARAKTGPQSGNFSFKKLPPGDYIIAADAHGKSTADSTLYWLYPVHFDEKNSVTVELTEKNTVLSKDPGYISLSAPTND